MHGFAQEMDTQLKNTEHLTMCQEVLDQLEGFCKRLDEKIDKEQQQVKACKKNTELELKLAQEMKLHNELTERLAKLSDRSCELDRVCANIKAHLTITESDQNRLDTAKETYQLEKELTGIRFDFSATQNIIKGYIKSESRKLLQPFEIPADDSEALWNLMHATAAPGWPFSLNKENLPNN